VALLASAALLRHDALADELTEHARSRLGNIFSREITFVDALP